MDRQEFQDRINAWLAPPLLFNPDKPWENFWETVGFSELDAKLVEILDLYKNANEEQRGIIQSYFMHHADRLWLLVLMIRRLGLMIKSSQNREWFEYGLNALRILDTEENLHAIDVRDLIVSLVILRHFYENFALEDGRVTTLLQQAMAEASNEMKMILENVIRHTEREIETTLLAFGPKEDLQPANEQHGIFTRIKRALCRP